VVFLSYLAALYQPLETLAYLAPSYASARAGARRVLEVLAVEEDVRDLAGARPLREPPAGAGLAVALEGVAFGYEPGRPVLEDLDLRIEAGERVALVGPSGAGKSTLVSLIPRFYDPWRGAVRIDGADVRTLQLASLRAQVAIVLQDACVLPLT